MKKKTKAGKVSCSFCERKYSTKLELSQHKRDKHKIVQCTFCDSHFSKQHAVLQHQKDKHTGPSHSTTIYARTNNSKKKYCSSCARSFTTATALLQHKQDTHDTTKSTTSHSAHFTERLHKPSCKNVKCEICLSRFSTTSALCQHMEDKHQRKQNNGLLRCTNVKEEATSRKYKCPKCAKSFSTNDAMSQHQRDTHRPVPNNPQSRKRSHHLAIGIKKEDEPTKQQMAGPLHKKRRRTVEEIYAKEVNIDKTEKKKSVEHVNDILTKIMAHVHRQQGGDIYCPNYVKAGSFPVNTKIGKADEFDINVCLKLGQKDVKVSSVRKINYSYSQNKHATNMNINCEPAITKTRVKPPDGYVVVSVDAGIIPEGLRYGEDLVPRKMKYDLHQKISTAITKLDLNRVHLSKMTHGPALTMTILPNKHSGVQYNISIDITISLPCDIPIMEWPRKETKKAFCEKLIIDVKETGTHLVPKKDEFWAISYSNAERALFSRLDEGNGCRKFVYKMLKKYMQICKSGSKNGLPGLSSHVLKTQILWSCEKHTSSGYWHNSNSSQCLIDVTADLVKTLKDGHLFDYFDTRVDVLQSKDSAVCLELANFLLDKKY
ncbi:uncharacterized protein LOC123549237 isoform X2 [Mercenaria mercenaria]|uniref:uncharacterized protein LOC123549237 isoform X2 n=1 Tax=Mercenaria mercenaria TaxID=6596 RepID=UPI00234E5C66|nr:uncharacterized protein LOC123549237 isoform X2 [Mercenaria mercenaria]